MRKENITISQQALSKARNKFDHTLFLKLIVALDDSATSLPNFPTLCEKFGGTGAKVSSLYARMSIAYIVLDDMDISVAFTELSTVERILAFQYLNDAERSINLKELIFIIDRGYVSEVLVRKLSDKNLFLVSLKK